MGATGPSAEVCDGVDNNCNGTVDDGNPQRSKVRSLTVQFNEPVTLSPGAFTLGLLAVYRIGVFVSCVTNDGSTYSATFGYSSEDTQANTIPVGEANRFFPVPEGRGQTTRFEAMLKLADPTGRSVKSSAGRSNMTFRTSTDTSISPTFGSTSSTRTDTTSTATWR